MALSRNQYRKLRLLLVFAVLAAAPIAVLDFQGLVLLPFSSQQLWRSCNQNNIDKQGCSTVSAEKHNESLGNSHWSTVRVSADSSLPLKVENISHWVSTVERSSRKVNTSATGNNVSLNQENFRTKRYSARAVSSDTTTNLVTGDQSGSEIRLSTTEVPTISYENASVHFVVGPGGSPNWTVPLNLVSQDPQTIQLLLSHESVRPPGKRIVYQLHPTKGQQPINLTTTTKIGPYSCPVGAAYGRDPLDESVRPILNFATTMQTNLKILVLGDSVAVQLWELLQEVTTSVTPHAAINDTYNNNTNNNLHLLRRVYRYSWGNHEGTQIQAPILGGGVLAGMRITHFWLKKRRNKPLPNSPGGGWTRQDVDLLLQHSYGVEQQHNGDNNKSSAPQTVGHFDAMIFRIPHGWIGLQDVTIDNMRETVELARDLLGVSTVIFVNIPFSNNVVSQEDFELYQHKNILLQEFANNFTNNNKDVNMTVMVLDLDGLTLPLIEKNAVLLGYNTTTEPLYYMDGIWLAKKNLLLSTAHVCAQKPHGRNRRDIDCVRNSITKDGMHWCMETLGGRIAAGLACLLSCSFNNHVDGYRSGDGNRSAYQEQKRFSKRPHDIRDCERSCNRRFMSTRTIPGDLFSKTLF